MNKMMEALKEEELIKRIASLPDKESRERILQAIEGAEKRERIRKRVKELRMKMKEERLRPIDREAITGARWEKKLAPIAAAIWSFLWVLSAIIFFVLTELIFDLPLLLPISVILLAVLIAVIVSIAWIYSSRRWYDEVVEKYYRDD